MSAVASPGMLSLSYPYGTSASQFSLLVSPFAKMKDVYSWDDVQGANVTVEGNANMTYSLGYAGEYGGVYAVIK
jgi:hypothetical protein